MCSGRLVCNSVCDQDYCKSTCNQPISLKLNVMNDWTYQWELINFGGDSVPDTDSGSFFHFHHHCDIGDWILGYLLAFLI